MTNLSSKCHFYNKLRFEAPKLGTCKRQITFERGLLHFAPHTVIIDVEDLKLLPYPKQLSYNYTCLEVYYAVAGVRILEH